MKTGFPDIRLVIFGPLTDVAASLANPSVKRALVMAATGRQPESVPPELVRWDLIQPDQEGWRPGPRLVFLPPLDPRQEEAIATAGRACAAVVTGAIGDLQQAVGESTSAPAEEAWQRHGLVTVAALLLDLTIGERLRSAGLVGEVAPGWRLWAVPHAPAVASFGARCIHDDASGIGAGILWYGTLPAPPLPFPGDLPALVAARSGAAASPESLLRLRYLGWLRGRQATALTLTAGSPLPDLLERVAAEAVEGAYTPLLDGTAFGWPRFDERRLILSRMTMELALHALITAGVVPAPTAETARHWVWEGRHWLLAAETAGGDTRATG